MPKKYTLLIIDDQGKPIRESRFSKSIIWVMAFALTVIVTAAGLGVFQFQRLQHVLDGKHQLQNKLSEQSSLIDRQNKQLQLFAEDINELKASLVSLNDFEQKIRIMANLEHKEGQADLFAIGGSMPDDLETDIEHYENHDALIKQMHEQADQIEQAADIQKASFDTLLDSLNGKRNILAATPSLRPTTGWISSKFGYRVSPFTGKREMHKGLDIANREKTPIIAPADGKVIYAKQKWLIGNMITIDHGYGMVTRYGHLHSIEVKKGDHIKRGQLIGLMGNTGRSTGPHLHYELKLNGVPVDPMKYIFD